ncbi:hypothetical protein [Paenarthrobacter sp. PH39-S1]|uniref:hypothetical protein n=1 Tax=Paenarthrobacter sp. PH39-S1 TaxID=3046204 RepID=UPI0024B90A4C|nr:hypothetical protein [Paenarthrobacter sp. PH39-S1]MDJ0354989.1 hypothetical protein [Paenarthrobacter sp. PH39-S1]
MLSIPVAVFQPALSVYLWIAIRPVSAMLGRFQWKKFAAAQTLLYAAADRAGKPAAGQQ